MKKQINFKNLRIKSLNLLTILVCVLAATHFLQSTAFAEPGKIVYSVGGSLWKMDGDGANPVQISFPASNELDFNPVFSPDGKQVAFTRSKATLTNPLLYVMNSDGNGLLSLGIEGYDPTWSPDGTQLAFVSGYDNTFGGRYYPNCSTSSDSYIQYYSLSSERIFTLAGSHNGTDPSWSPDGTKIAFVKNRVLADYGVYATTLATNVTNRLTFDESLPADPEWSSTGAKIVYARNYVERLGGCPHGDMNTGGGPNGLRGGEIVSFDVAFGTYQTLLGQYGFSPEWSPDNSKVLYSNGGTTSPELWTMNNDGTNNTQIPNGQTSEFAGSWSY